MMSSSVCLLQEKDSHKLSLHLPLGGKKNLKKSTKMSSPVSGHYKASDLRTYLDTIIDSRKQLENSLRAREFIEGSSNHAEEIDLVTEMSELICKHPDEPVSHVAYTYYTNNARQIYRQNWQTGTRIDMDFGIDLVTAYVRNW